MFGSRKKPFFPRRRDWNFLDIFSGKFYPMLLTEIMKYGTCKDNFLGVLF